LPVASAGGKDKTASENGELFVEIKVGSNIDENRDYENLKEQDSSDIHHPSLPHKRPLPTVVGSMDPGVANRIWIALEAELLVIALHCKRNSCYKN
jgi:hypothetical protein